MTAKPPTKRRDEPKTPISEEARAARNAYLRSYRKAHPQKVAAWNRAYWERKATADPEGKVNED